jgi:hypothetical protein
MRRTLVVVLSAVLVLASTMPATAGPPERADWPIHFNAFDADNGLLTFVNMTRDNLCDWAAGGFDGPPPVEELITVQSKETGQGAVVESLRAQLPFEIWAFEGVPSFANVCAPELEGPWATGTGRVSWTDNDFFISGTRTNSFGGSFQASVTDTEGVDWRYTFRLRFEISMDDEFIVRAMNFTLARTGSPT